MSLRRVWFAGTRPSGSFDCLCGCICSYMLKTFLLVRSFDQELMFCAPDSGHVKSASATVPVRSFDRGLPHTVKFFFEMVTLLELVPVRSFEQVEVCFRAGTCWVLATSWEVMKAFFFEATSGGR